MSEKKKSGGASGAIDYIRNKTGFLGISLEGGLRGAFAWGALQMLSVSNPLLLSIGAGAFVANSMGGQKGGKK